MTENWILQEIERTFSTQKRVVLIDPTGTFANILPILEKKNYTLLKTDPEKREEWERTKEELMIRYEAESIHKTGYVVFYVTRPKSELSFLFDYCFTHGCVDLSNPIEWIQKKIFSTTGLQMTLNSNLLLTAIKLGMGKDIGWWKRILQNLEEMVTLEEELIPFLYDPELYFKDKEADVKRLLEEKLFNLIGQSYRTIPAPTLATEVINYLFLHLLKNTISKELLEIYYKWLDSKNYSTVIQKYIDAYSISSEIDLWEVHPDHCFVSIDRKQLQQITEQFTNKSFVNQKLLALKPRIKSRKVMNFIPKWWEDVLTITEFDNSPLSQCDSFEKVCNFYTHSFHNLDRAIRNIYAEFIQDKGIVKPLQEHYESLNHELLGRWFEFHNQYKTNQQGYLPQIFSQAKPRTAIIVGDGVRYEIAAYIAMQLKSKCKIAMDVMLADMPSETEHNMTALYVGNSEVIAVHNEREKKLSEKVQKKITYMNLEALHYGVEDEFLVLTYKDIDNAGEKLQLGAIKLFSEFENVLIEKINLLLNIGYHTIYLVTDHGFVLTGLLEESDKIEPIVSGKKEVHERFVRTVEEQSKNDWIFFKRPYGEFKYVYASKSHRPFKSRGVYGFSHGGFTPQEIIIPNFKFTKELNSVSALEVVIHNKKSLGEVTGEIFGLKIQAKESSESIFSVSRKVQVQLYANNIPYSISNVVTIEPGKIESLEFSFNGNKEITVILLDANSQEQIDSVKIKKIVVRDLGGLL
jgi:hypothetical protein